MTKAISSAADFLRAIQGKTEVFEVDGVVFELRSLPWADTQVIMGKYADNQMEALFQLALASIKAPEVTEEQLRQAPPTMVIGLGTQASQLSGLNASAGPLDGSGSSLSTVKTTDI